MKSLPIHALKSRQRAAAALGLGVVMAQAAAAAAAATPGHPCAGIVASAERLACFDRHHPATATTAASQAGSAATALLPALPAPATAHRPATAAPGAAAEASFGLPPDPSASPRELESITAVVREIAMLRRGERVFVLDNGQRWAERLAESRGALNPGDRVTVGRGSFGSFLLVTPAGVGLPVRRLP